MTQNFLFGSLLVNVILRGERREKESLTTVKLQRKHKMDASKKLYTIAEYIKASPKHTRVLLIITRGKMIRQDNEICWN